MLAAMFSERYKVDRDRDGNYFIDMDGIHFKHILNYLRNDQHLPPRNIAQEILVDAMYLGINSLVDRLRALDNNWEEIRNSVPSYSEMKEKIIRLGESVDVSPDIPPSWKFHPHIILDFVIENGLKINEKHYEACRKISQPGVIEINCAAYEDAAALAACLYKDLLNDGYNVKIEELHPCILDISPRPVSGSSANTVSVGIKSSDNDFYNNFRFMFIFDWRKVEYTD